MKRTLSKISAIFLPIILLLFIAQPAFAAESAHSFDGGALSIWWVIPFAGILLSIAIFPLVAPDFWHHHFGKVSAFWGACMLIPMLLSFGFATTLYEVLHVYLLEYIPFIILLFALFTISGGIRIKGYLKGTPEVNTLFLLIGTILASWMGTTGAAMLLIRPMLRANQWREKKVHMVVFFIFLVANVGGSLTPLGDPPLFLGFLQGVDFFWTTQNLFWEMSFVVVILLVIYYFWDRYLFHKEPMDQPEDDGKEPLGIEGAFNIILLAGVPAAVLFSGVYHLGEFTVYDVHMTVQSVIRDVTLLILSWLSWVLTSKESRAANGFTWFPIQEVGKLFAGIFITIIAPIAMLKAGKEGEGALQMVNDLVFTGGPNPEPVNGMFFWVTGTLSAFLDNAPTYLVFFNAAGGQAEVLMNELSQTLVAISSGAVFFGAVTYIGNAPNFMVKSIAETSGVDMPSFGGYMLWSVGILCPIYLLVTWLFI
ncbi:sodium:proton antiporter [Balneolaceae bacterium YR4-1]|uniref:Sodium:proton antiporter n=1 Tax=Halalkalibaculum roseum TaxID=2709311 RepID=A0A6M1SXV8_9BACT|nr:sodium:proton antiporter [Halalkalibaculum roseum]NGP75974.1 sodium:proton antiporter [Halalkalibaculum roseum]